MIDASQGRGLTGLTTCDGTGPGMGVRDDSGLGEIIMRWAQQNPRSAALHARARRLLPGGVTHDVRLAEPFPLAVARASGSRKWDLDGHELICYVMGHGALLLGHSHPEGVASVRGQAAVAVHA